MITAPAQAQKVKTSSQVQKAIELKKQQCTNILHSCHYLEHREKYTNLPRYRDLDKDKIIGDTRLQKLDDMFEQVTDNDYARDPQIVKKLFIY